ncbi:MAG: alpha/beta hydrolase [Candidatus Omnitrophica bacterium]|nr:alpha/beta hydrolase [Candidatus Omnitrophota bacterium]
MKILLEILLIPAVLGVIIAYLRFTEKRIIFYPSGEIELTPQDIGLKYEDVFFDSRDGVKLNAWFVPVLKEKATIIFCHGNAGNISHRLEKVKAFCDLGYNVLVFDYRGYGKSQGSPSEQGLYSDTQAAYDYLLARGVESNQIIGFGESLGGAVIVDLASKNELRALILESTFSSGKDMSKVIYPYIPPWVFSSRFDSVGKIKSVSAPKLVIHSINDEIVPYRLSRKLYDAAAQPKEFLEIRGGHNSGFFECEELMKEKLASFLNEVAENTKKNTSATSD